MSFDLMVFAPEAAPAKRAAFLEWYDRNTEWEDEAAGDDPAICGPALQAFYADLAASFPPLPADSEVEDSGTEYMIAPSLIYLAFLDWERIDGAHEAVFRLAAKHMLGFFDLSSDLGEVWLPDKKGGLRIAHSD